MGLFLLASLAASRRTSAPSTPATEPSSPRTGTDRVRHGFLVMADAPVGQRAGS
ncbi:MAG: hypothetical protein ACPLRH_01075 [Desulfotomaculales bacterium]